MSKSKTRIFLFPGSIRALACGVRRPAGLRAMPSRKHLNYRPEPICFLSFFGWHMHGFAIRSRSTRVPEFDILRLWKPGKQGIDLSCRLASKIKTMKIFSPSDNMVPPIITLPFPADRLHESHVWIDIEIKCQPVKAKGRLSVEPVSGGSALSIEWTDARNTSMCHQHYLTQEEADLLREQHRAGHYFSLNK